MSSDNNNSDDDDCNFDLIRNLRMMAQKNLEEEQGFKIATVDFKPK